MELALSNTRKNVEVRSCRKILQRGRRTGKHCNKHALRSTTDSDGKTKFYCSVHHAERLVLVPVPWDCLSIIFQHCDKNVALVCSTWYKIAKRKKPAPSPISA